MYSGAEIGKRGAAVPELSWDERRDQPEAWFHQA